MPERLRWLNQSPAVPLWVSVGDDDRTVTGMLGGGGKMDGESGFSRPALLIGNHDCFHERENIGILAFRKEIIRTGMACRATRRG